MKKKAVILVVEDDFLIRMDAADIVSSAGYEAVEASSADEAVLILRSRDDIDLVFTDVVMPGTMDGLQFAFYVRQHYPKVGIIVASGTLVVDRDTLPSTARFFVKPYSDREIADEMANLLKTADIQR